MSDLLLIDTSTHWLVLALAKERQIVKFRIARINRSSDDWLDTGITDFLKENGRDFSAVSGIGYGRGPGSFTGLRVSAVYLESTAILTAWELYTFDSLPFWFDIAGCVPGDILAIQQNRSLFYCWGESGFRTLTDPEIAENPDIRVIPLPVTSQRYPYPVDPMHGSVKKLPDLSGPMERIVPWYGHQPDYLPQI